MCGQEKYTGKYKPSSAKDGGYSYHHGRYAHWKKFVEYHRPTPKCTKDSSSLLTKGIKREYREREYGERERERGRREYARLLKRKKKR